MGDWEMGIQDPHGHRARRGGPQQAGDGMFIPRFKGIDSLPSAEHLGRVSGYYGKEKPFMCGKSGMGTPRGAMTSRTNNSRLCQAPCPPFWHFCFDSVELLHFAFLWLRHFLSTRKIPLPGAPRGSKGISMWRLCQGCSELCPVEFGFESLGKACAEFGGVAPGLCWHLTHGSAVIYSVAT